MSVFLNAGKHIMLDALAALIDEVSLHTGEPDGSGSSEIDGGDPAYARLEPAFDPASGGEAVLAAGLEFDIPPETTVAWVGFWADGVFVGKGVLANAEVYAGQGKFTLSASTKLAILDPA